MNNSCRYWRWLVWLLYIVLGASQVRAAGPFPTPEAMKMGVYQFAVLKSIDENNPTSTDIEGFCTAVALKNVVVGGVFKYGIVATAAHCLSFLYQEGRPLGYQERTEPRNLRRIHFVRPHETGKGCDAPNGSSFLEVRKIHVLPPSLKIHSEDRLDSIVLMIVKPKAPFNRLPNFFPPATNILIDTERQSDPNDDLVCHNTPLYGGMSPFLTAGYSDNEALPAPLRNTNCALRYGADTLNAKINDSKKTIWLSGVTNAENPQGFTWKGDSGSPLLQRRGTLAWSTVGILSMVKIDLLEGTKFRYSSSYMNLCSPHIQPYLTRLVPGFSGCRLSYVPRCR